MAFWGIKLNQNDTSLDVKEQFESMIKLGENVEDATNKLINEYECMMNIQHEKAAFWFSLADTQWNMGLLLPFVKEQALKCIEESFDVNCVQGEQDHLEEKQKAMFDKLKKKLITPQPEPKISRRSRLFKCNWKYGDVYAYPIECELAKERNLNNRYLLIRKVDEGIWYPGHIIPIVTVKITNDNKLPQTVDEYNRLEYVQTWFTKYEDRFFPIDFSRPKEDIAEKSKLIYITDEYGFLPQYRMKIICTSKKSIPEKLIYIGCFRNVLEPNNEFIPHSKINISSETWGDFENVILKRYFLHNLRECKIYHKE